LKLLEVGLSVALAVFGVLDIGVPGSEYIMPVNFQWINCL
jgi:hypothetical protein